MTTHFYPVFNIQKSFQVETSISSRDVCSTNTVDQQYPVGYFNVFFLEHLKYRKFYPNEISTPKDTK